MLKTSNVNNAFFITSTGTELGKTYCTVEIIKSLISKNFKVRGAFVIILLLRCYL